MEGLIPLVIHAIKKSKKRSKYRSLSQGSSRGFAGDLSWIVDGDGSSSHTHQYRRPISELQLAPGHDVAGDHLHAGRHLALVVVPDKTPPPQAAARSGNMMRRTASSSIW